MITFSTWLTLTRVFLAPCIMFAIYRYAWVIACFLFVVAAMTDLLDGYCARLYNEETEFGRILDPIADKILLFATLFALYQISECSVIPSWFIYLMIGKDIILLIGGLYLLMQKKSTVLAPSLLSKWITALLMIFSVYVMFIYYCHMPTDYVEQFIQFVAICTIIIMFDYSYQFVQRIMGVTR